MPTSENSRTRATVRGEIIDLLTPARAPGFDVEGIVDEYVRDYGVGSPVDRMHHVEFWALAAGYEHGPADA